MSYCSSTHPATPPSAITLDSFALVRDELGSIPRLTPTDAARTAAFAKVKDFATTMIVSYFREQLATA